MSVDYVHRARELVGLAEGDGKDLNERRGKKRMEKV